MTTAVSPQSCYFKALDRSMPSYVVQEAFDALMNHPSTPAAWKRNIKAFLFRCQGEVPYIARWVWATWALTHKMYVRQRRKVNGVWTSAEVVRVKAPFKYFKMCLAAPKQWVFSSSRASVMRGAEVYKWLVEHKGWAAANAWRLKQPWYSWRKKLRAWHFKQAKEREEGSIKGRKELGLDGQRDDVLRRFGLGSAPWRRQSGRSSG